MSTENNDTNTENNEETLELVIHHYKDLKPLNTFNVPCSAQSFIAVETTGQFQKLIDYPVYKNSAQKVFLGGGSNVLFTDEVYKGLVIKNAITGKEVLEEDQESVTIRVGGGENWNEFVLWAINNDYCGVENLISIPGSVGAAPMQNIGAYGVELAELVKEVRYCDSKTGELIALSADECEFGYRDSIFKNKLKNKAFIVDVTLELPVYHKDTYKPVLEYGAVEEEAQKVAAQSNKGVVSPQVVAEAVASIRERKLPDWRETGTAGSFFKNPILSVKEANKITKEHDDLKTYDVTENGEDKVKFSAGQLIELAGCKGMKKGPVGTYKDHALVIVNHGGGTGKEILALAEEIQEKVKEKFGIELTPEVTYL